MIVPRKKATLNVSTFSGGLITEDSKLAFPDNAATDLLNCDVLPTAEVVRRLGVDFESSYELSAASFSDAELSSFAISTHEWKAVAGTGTRQFLVVQIGSTVYFYDQAVSPLSDGKKSFTVDLDSYLTPAATDASTEAIDVTSGRGFLFMVSAFITPLKVSYDPSGDSITVSVIDFKVRDLEGVDDSLDLNEEPVTLSAEHEYNLKNQGWVASSYDPIVKFFTDTSVYPSNAQVPWYSTYTSGLYEGQVNGPLIRKAPSSTSEAAKGRYLLNPFFRDRSTASGVAGLDTVTTDSRPSCIAFFSGRVAYAGITNGPHAGDVFISEVINSTASNAGRCYQIGDPTAEEDSILVASDGVVIPIPEAGNIVALASLGTALLVLASNGAWAITGIEGSGFKATAFQVNNVAGEEAGCVSRQAVVDIGGKPAWWGETGIYGTEIDNVTLQPVVGSLTDNTILTFYQAINALDRVDAAGKYDKAGKKVFWFYKDRDTAPANSSPHYYTKCLVLNTLTGAFMPYSISSLASDSPFVCGIYGVPQVATVNVTDPVTVGGVQVTINSGADDVTVPIAQAVRSTFLTGLLHMVPDGGGDNNYTFGQFLNTSFIDWEQADSTGIDFSSYVEVGYYTLGETAKNKQLPYLISHFRRTETGFLEDPDGGDGYVFSNPSGCTVQVKWDWTDSSAAGKWTTPEQAYRFHRPFVVDEATLAFDDGYEINTSKIKVPGNGKALAIKYASVAGKDFRLLGWVLDEDGATGV